MLVILAAIVIGLLVFSVFVLFFNEEARSGGMAVTFGKGICGFLATSLGGFGAAICNI